MTRTLSFFASRRSCETTKGIPTDAGPGGFHKVVKIPQTQKYISN